MKTVGNKQVQGPVELLDQSTVSQPSDGYGRLYKKPGDLGLYWKADSIGAEVNLTTAGTSAERISIPVSQTLHGFVAGNAVYLSGSSFLKAIANDLESVADGIVYAVGDVNNFTYVPAGSITLTASEWSGVVGTSGMTVGTHYFLSSTDAGKYTTTEPGISQRLLVAKSANTAFLINDVSTLVNRNVVIPANSSGSIMSVYGSQLSGKYELFDRNDALLEATIFYNGTDLRVQSFDSRITITPNTSGTLNIYLSGLIYIQNKTASDLDLTIYRKAI
jgi:hypothetical protein